MMKAILLLMIGVNLPAWAQSLPLNHFVLTAGQIAQTLTNNGMPATGDQISLLATVIATEPSPALDIVSVESLEETHPNEPRSRMKLTCRLPGACLPFYAIVTRLQGTPGWSSDSGSKAKLEITMRAGTHAILILDDHRSRIQLAVISLESGAAGKWIRVASPDHKQFYRGEVVSANELRGSF